MSDESPFREADSAAVAVEAPAANGAVPHSSDLRGKASYKPDVHRLLPQSPDAEQGVLSSCLLSPKEVIGLCVEKGVDRSCFHIPAHGEIFLSMLNMWNEGRPIDFITLTGYLRDTGRLDNVGGPGFVTHLFTFLPTAANANYYLDILIEKRTLRECICIGTDFAARGYEEQDDVSGYLAEFETKVFAIAKEKQVTAPTMQQTVMEVIADIQDAYDRRGEVRGLTTGFSDLDKLTDGLHPEEMFVIAARPSMGKSALAMNMVDHIAVTRGLPVAVFSLEMSRKQLVHRLVCSRGRVNYFRVRDGFLEERDFPALQRAATDIASAKIFIEDDGGQSIQRIRAKARRLVSEHGVAAVFVDYLQLARSERRSEKRSDEVSDVSNGCKLGAKETKVPWVVLAQISRQVEQQQRRPRLSDLRDSGAIEQDADSVAFLVNEEVAAETEEEKAQVAGRAYLSIQKQRSGPQGIDVPLTWIKEYTRFETRAYEQNHEQEPQLPL